MLVPQPAAWWSEQCVPGRGRDNVTTVVVDVVGDPGLHPDSSDQLVLAFQAAVFA